MFGVRVTGLLEKHPPWRQLLFAAVVLPLVTVLAVLAFAWPSARLKPRDLPIGVIGTAPATRAAVAGLSTAAPGAFDTHLYADDRAAIAAIRARAVYGALDVSGTAITVYEASAASPAVAALLTTTGDQLATRLSQHTGIQPAVHVRDVVPISASDPKGSVLASALLPLTICSIIIAAALGLLIGFHPAWRQITALLLVSAAAGLGAYLIAEGFLGALPGEHTATWAALALTILAMTAATGGLIALIGAPGLGLAAIMFVFLGNPFSAATSAPELLPGAVKHLGQWLPPGAGANLLRSTAYFHGNNAGDHLAILVTWTAFGLVAVVIVHHTSPRFAAHPSRSRARHEQHKLPVA